MHRASPLFAVISARRSPQGDLNEAAGAAADEQLGDS
jgi:hypothetical protein